ncbi:hypothetical protein, partial [Spongiibacter tropicus]|uniref:hypothetical protein n=1 Tax=Spongiibacter tropicus TaxID=454602 RepID=UPI003008D934
PAAKCGRKYVLENLQTRGQFYLTTTVEGISKFEDQGSTSFLAGDSFISITAYSLPSNTFKLLIFSQGKITLQNSNAYT